MKRKKRRQILAHNMQAHNTLSLLSPPGRPGLRVPHSVSSLCPDLEPHPPDHRSVVTVHFYLLAPDLLCRELKGVSLFLRRRSDPQSSRQEDLQ